MIVQKWRVELDGEAHEIEYKFSKLSGKTILTVDGDSFCVKGKPFGIGAQRNEFIIVGMTQGMLRIDKKGKAQLVLKDATKIENI